MKRYALAVQNPMVEQALNDLGLIASACAVVRNREELEALDLHALQLDYLFFPHWSYIVPASIYQSLDCVCFHATPLPYGRGGSPIQNMIRHGHETTEICALRMTAELDAGPVYLRKEHSLAGSGEDLFNGLYRAVASMVQNMLLHDYRPVEQSGAVTVFKRLTEADNRLPLTGSAKAMYDHIRMTDVHFYPSAWLDHGDWKLEFSEPVLEADQVSARVIFKKLTDE